MAVFLYNNDIFTSRMPKARLEKALKQREMISDEDYAKVIGLANIVRPVRSFLFKTPDVYGMTYEERFIPSIDGVPIEMWYIPVKGAPSDKLVIFNPACPCAARASRGISVSHSAVLTRSRSTSSSSTST